VHRTDLIMPEKELRGWCLKTCCETVVYVIVSLLAMLCRA